MRIIIIRHADPDYEHDCVTEVGKKEIVALGKMYHASDFDEVYASPLGRAKLTAEGVIKDQKKINIEPWLKEFTYKVYDEQNNPKLTWDFLPDYFTSHPEYYDNHQYLDSELFKTGEIKKYYQEIITNLDDILARHGYVRKNDYYEVKKPNRQTIVFFCHLGTMSVLMSHLMNVPYVVLAQVMCCPPTGVTTLASEERRNGVAQFRCLSYGDTSHLARFNLKPSFSARFCETFDSDERHD